MYRRILVPMDGSTAADRGLSEALGVAKAFGAELLLLHVVDPYPMMVDMVTPVAWEQYESGLHALGETLLGEARKRAEQAGVAVQTRLERNPAFRVCDVIVAQARERQCDLIVMGTHGRRGVSHALLGSDAERVLRSSPVPVLLVRSAAKD